MNLFLNARRVRRGLGALAALAVLPATACTSVDEVLSVEDPDIINPGDVSSAAGANALYNGALSRLNAATSGYNGGSSGETLWQFTGLLADEWRSGDTFQQRNETDQRVVPYENSLIRTGYLYAHRARVAAQQALAALRAYAPSAPASQLAEMYFVQAYIENQLAEAFCSGVPFSTVTDGKESFEGQLTTAQVYERALAHADSGLALLGASGDANVRHALAVTKGRILLNMGQYEQAAAAVADVPTTFAYENEHSASSYENANWFVNNSLQRYVLGNGEGGNGIDFFGANDPRVPACKGGDATCRAQGITSTKPFDSQAPLDLFVQLKYATNESRATVAGGIEARLIEAEAALKRGDAPTALARLNTLRATETGLAPLTEVTVDVLMRERAFWLFGTGHRLGDLRRLVRQYDRSAETVFPTGDYVKGGAYGTDVNLPIPQYEENNPSVPDELKNKGGLCLDRNA